jgi:hypothetical protein
MHNREINIVAHGEDGLDEKEEEEQVNKKA